MSSKVPYHSYKLHTYFQWYLGQQKKGTHPSSLALGHLSHAMGPPDTWRDGARWRVPGPNLQHQHFWKVQLFILSEQYYYLWFATRVVYSDCDIVPSCVCIVCIVHSLVLLDHIDFVSTSHDCNLHRTLQSCKLKSIRFCEEADSGWDAEITALKKYCRGTYLVSFRDFRTEVLSWIFKDIPEMTPFCPFKGAPNDAEECKSRLRATDLISKPPATEICTILRVTLVSHCLILKLQEILWKNDKLEAHQTIVWRYTVTCLYQYSLYNFKFYRHGKNHPNQASNESLDLNKDGSFQWNSPVELIAKLLCCPRSIGKPSRTTPPQKKCTLHLMYLRRGDCAFRSADSWLQWQHHTGNFSTNSMGTQYFLVLYSEQVRAHRHFCKGPASNLHTSIRILPKSSNGRNNLCKVSISLQERRNLYFIALKKPVDNQEVVFKLNVTGCKQSSPRKEEALSTSLFKHPLCTRNSCTDI